MRTPLSLGTAERLKCGRQTNTSHLRGPDSAEQKGSQVLKFVPMVRLQPPGQVKPGEICCHLCMPQTPWQLGSIRIHLMGIFPQGIVQVCVCVCSWDHTGLYEAQCSGVCVRMWGGSVGPGDPLEYHFFIQEETPTPGAP